MGQTRGPLSFLNPSTPKQVSQVHKLSLLGQAASSNLLPHWMTQEEKDGGEDIPRVTPSPSSLSLLLE